MIGGHNGELLRSPACLPQPDPGSEQGRINALAHVNHDTGTIVAGYPRWINDRTGFLAPSPAPICRIDARTMDLDPDFTRTRLRDSEFRECQDVGISGFRV